MVRNYKRIKEKGYTQLQLEKAVEDVKNNRLSSSQASKLYGIPRTTINTRIKCIHATAGRPTVFSSDFEKQIAHNLHVMEKHGFPLTRKEASVLISEYVRRNGITTPFKQDIPGKDWFQAFQKRNNLSIKKPQNVEIARRKACDPFTIYGYFELLERVVKELGLEEKPKQIYNLDETSICNDPSKGKIIGRMGYKATRTTSGPGRNNTTILLATNACGDKIPPLIIFQGKYLWTQWLYPNENVKTAYAVTEKGWMETTIFERYMRETFVPAIGTIRPVLLIFDGHSTHVDLSVIEYAASQDITILKLPPHSSHILQPLDCSAMKPLKDRWEDEIIKWQRLHIGAKLPKNEFARIITQIWDEMNPVILMNGFRKAGAYPVNRNTIPKELFDINLYQKWESFQAQQNQNQEESFKNDDSNVSGGFISTTVGSIPSLLILTLKKLNEVEFNDLRSHSNPHTVDNHMQHSKKTEQYTTNIRVKRDVKKTYINLKTVGLKNANPSQYDLPNTNILTTSNKLKHQNPIMLKIPSRFKDIDPQTSFKVLDVKTIPPPKKSYENVSFEEILLQTIAKNDAPVNRKTRVTNSKAEVLTYKHVVERMNKEKAEKDLIQQNKLKRKLAKSVKKKENTIQKKKPKPGKKKNLKAKIKYTDSDSNSTGSYKPIDDSDDEDVTAFYKSLLEDDQSDKDKDDRTTETNFTTTCSNITGKKLAKSVKKKENTIQKKKPKSGKKKNLKAKIKYTDSDSNSTGSYKSIDDSYDEDVTAFYKSLLEDDQSDKDKDDRTTETNFTTCSNITRKKRAATHNYINTEASTSKEKPKENPYCQKGQFILAKFYSAKGKKTYKYVCEVEDVTDNKIVVLGLKSKKKQNNVFNIVENDLSIIGYEDIETFLPYPQICGKDYIFPCKVEILEL